MLLAVFDRLVGDWGDDLSACVFVAVGYFVSIFYKLSLLLGNRSLIDKAIDNIKLIYVAYVADI